MSSPVRKGLGLSEHQHGTSTIEHQNEAACSAEMRTPHVKSMIDLLLSRYAALMPNSWLAQLASNDMPLPPSCPREKPCRLGPPSSSSSRWSTALASVRSPREFKKVQRIVYKKAPPKDPPPDPQRIEPTWYPPQKGRLLRNRWVRKPVSLPQSKVGKPFLRSLGLTGHDNTGRPSK